MKAGLEGFVEEALEFGASGATLIDASIIKYSPGFRGLCEQNRCGHYGTNWMCPPAVGAFEELKAKAGRYRNCLVFQTVHKIAHSLDWRGMKSASRVHDNVLRKIVEHISFKQDIKELLCLGAGPCKYCTTCSAVEGEACPFPDKAVASLESYGIDVGELVKSCGIPYYNGKNTVSYVGCILFTCDD